MPVYTIVTANGKNAVLLSITRQPSSNTVAVADAVAQEVAQLQQKLPPGVKLELFYDQSQLVRDSISSVRDAICIGLVLACVILFLFLRDWTSSLIAGLVIPVTIAITILVLWIIGESFNLMTLGGLAAAIGLLIDDAIVVVENIVMHRDAGEHRAEAVRKALRELTVPLLGSTITPVVVFLPLVSVSGVTGIFFRALAITMTAALLTSLALALTWTPGLSYVLLREHKPEDDISSPPGPEHDPEDESRQGAGRLLRRVLQLHARVLEWALAKPRWSAASACSSFSPPGAAISCSAPICCRIWTRAASSSTTSCPPAARSARPIACSRTSRAFSTPFRKSKTPRGAPACSWAWPRSLRPTPAISR